MYRVYRTTVAESRRRALARMKDTLRAIPKGARTPYAREMVALANLYQQVFLLWSQAPEDPPELPAEETPPETALDEPVQPQAETA